MAGANEITAYLLLHLSKEFPEIDVWRNNRVDAMAVGRGGKKRRVTAGVDGQADLSGIIGPRGRRAEIEVKAPGDNPRSTQVDFQRRVESKGAFYAVCRVRHPQTIVEIRERLSLRPGLSVDHPEEIKTFFAELRTRLTSG